VQTKA